MNATDALHLFQRPGLDDLDDSDDVIDWVAAYVGSDEFNDAVTQFCEENAAAFAPDEGEEEATENKLE